MQVSVYVDDILYIFAAEVHRNILKRGDNCCIFLQQKESCLLRNIF